MKKMLLLTVMACLIFSGCVSLIVQKEIQVKKDANGKVIETVEIERATQQGAAVRSLQFDYLKNKKDDAKPAKIY